MILYKIICIVFFAFFSDPEYLWLLTSVLLLGAGYNYYLSKTERPYYNDTLAILYNITNACYFFVNFVLFLCMLLQETDFAGGIQLLCIGTPLVAVMEYFSRHPKYAWTAKDFESLDNEKDCAKYLRYITHIIVKSKQPENKIALEGHVTQHIQSCRNPNCHMIVYKANYRSKDANSKRSLVSKMALNNYMRVLYKDALKKFPHYPALRISYAFFLLEIMEDSARAQKQLKKAQLSHPQLDDDFVIFRYCRIIQEKITEHKHKGEIGMDRVSLIAYDNYFRQCKSRMKEAARLHAEFWSSLNVQVPDLAQLIQVAGSINRVIVDIEEYWGLMESMSANMPRAIRQYAKFLRDVLGDEDGEREMLKNIKQDHRRAGKDTDSVLDSEFGAHFAESCSSDGIPYLLVSGEQKSLGVIKAANKSASRIFGYCAEQLVEQHVDKLVPPLLRNSHRKLLQQSNNNPDAFTFLNREKAVPCMLSNGYILIMAKMIRALPSFSNNMNYVVTFKLDRNLQMRSVCHLLVDSGGTVQSMSESNLCRTSRSHHDAEDQQ